MKKMIIAGKYTIILLILVLGWPVYLQAEEQRTTNIDAPNIMLMNYYTKRQISGTYPEAWYHGVEFKPDSLPFMTGGPLFFANDGIIRKVATDKFSNIYEEYCERNHLQNLILKIRSKLEEKGVKILVPEYSERRLKNDHKTRNDFGAINEYTINDMSILEKRKYPLALVIRRYEILIKPQGREKSPIMGLGAYTFDGILSINAEVNIEVVDSRSNEIIDRIKVYKTYKSDPMRFAITITGLHYELTEGAESMQRAFTMLFDEYYKDIASSVLDYDYKAALDVVRQ